MRHQTMKDLFRNWLANAKPGDEFVYAPSAATIGDGRMKRPEAEEAWRAAMSGHVHLVQRVVPFSVAQEDGGRLFDYTAVRSGKGA